MKLLLRCWQGGLHISLCPPLIKIEAALSLINSGAPSMACVKTTRSAKLNTVLGLTCQNHGLRGDK